MLHQLPTTFDHAGTTDHRFYDRYYIGAYDPAGGQALHTSMGVYKNANVMDGFISVQHDGKQYNLRLSRALRPSVADQRVGPLRYETVEPLHSLRIELEPSDFAVSCSLLWEGIVPPIEEKEH